MSQFPQVFEYEKRPVRTVMVYGEPWFVAKDVCDILEISNSRDAIGRLDADEKGVVSTDTLGGTQEVQAVNEPGLYTLILGSRKPEARQFKRWITHEVIPAIRRTGAYATPMSIEDLIIMQAQSVKDLKAQVEQVQSQLTVAHHRIDNLDATDVIGDPRQRLNAMVRKLARKEGIPYNAAWTRFIQAFNTAYRTNLELLKSNYQGRIKKAVSTPEFLEVAGRLDDAIRVADKLLSQISA